MASYRERSGVAALDVAGAFGVERPMA